MLPQAKKTLLGGTIFGESVETRGSETVLRYDLVFLMQTLAPNTVKQAGFEVVSGRDLQNLRSDLEFMVPSSFDCLKT